MNVRRALGRVERVEILDAPASITSRIAGRLIGQGRFARALRGSWLGHPVHPLLVTLPNTESAPAHELVDQWPHKAWLRCCDGDQRHASFEHRLTRSRIGDHRTPIANHRRG